MVYWVAVACRQARVEAERKQVHVAASIDKDQSVITRFERHESVPNDLDTVIAGYADDLDIPAVEFWKRAIELWESAADPEALLAEEVDRAASELEGSVPDAEVNGREHRQAGG